MICLFLILQSLLIHPVRTVTVPDHSEKVGISVTGDLYLLSSTANTIYRLSADGQLIGQYGRKGTGAQFFNQPVSLWCSNDLLIHVADRNNHRITTLSRELGLIGQMEGIPFDGQEERFRYPGGVVVTPGGDWFILDTGNKRIIRLNPRQTITSILGDIDAGLGRLIQPDRLILTENRLFVHDQAGANWQEFDGFGNTLQSFPDSLGTPASVLSTLCFVRQDGRILMEKSTGEWQQLSLPEGSQVLDVVSKGNQLFILTNRLLLTYLLEME